MVRFAIYAPLATGADDLEADFLTHVAMVPVVAAHHPLAGEPQPISRDVIAAQVQLVLTDRSPLTSKLRGGIYSERIWRFADLGTRLEYLLAGFGWCHMPLHLVEDLIERGQLKRLRLVQGEGFSLPLHVVRQGGHRLGRASQWFINDVRERLLSWKPCRHPPEDGATDLPRDAITPISMSELTHTQP
jgi:DNA-binding transcriptional LysR family regulator